jgi:1,4-dihydroxy-2-naphthoate octaprenyltransferase
LTAAAAPVLVGAAAAFWGRSAFASASAFSGRYSGGVGRVLLALGVALALQIGVNFANDYSDGIRGTDLNRKGPFRLTASRAASPKAVRNAAVISFGIAALLGLWLVYLTAQWWLVLVGLAAIVAAWCYTGGKHPYGYIGLGEIFVFCFFGLVATLGTTYVILGALNVMAILGAVGLGLLACAILMINNIRDIPTDTISGKKTLAVRLGDYRARLCYLAFLLGALVCGLLAAVLGAPLAWALLLLVIPGFLITVPVRMGAQGALLIPVLAGTSALELAYALILSFALILL